MSGIEAVRKIVETEAQARRIVEEAKARAEVILARASQETENVRREILAKAAARKLEVLRSAREDAEAEAAKSDEETAQRLESYGKAFEGRKELAVKKAVELVMRG